MESIYKLADELIEKHENWDTAAEELVEIAFTDSDMMEKYTRPLVKRAITDLVTSVGQQQRSKLFNGDSVPTCPKGVSGETLQKNKKGVATAIQQTIMDMWLNKCKKKLGDATKEDLDCEIEMYSNNARWNEKRYQFLKELSDGLKDGQTVKKSFTTDQIEALKQRACGKIDRKWLKRKAA